MDGEAQHAGFIDCARAAEFWPLVRPLVSKAIERVGTNANAMAEIEAGVKAGRIFVWVAHDGDAIRTAMIATHAGDTLDVTAAAGRLSDVFVCLPQMEEVATQLGCRRMVIWGRRGWQRVLRGRGWKHLAVLVEKKLCPSPV